jgi:diguanylate cyclase (GGDEF)-like protein
MQPIKRAIPSETFTLPTKIRGSARKVGVIYDRVREAHQLAWENYRINPELALSCVETAYRYITPQNKECLAENNALRSLIHAEQGAWDIAEKYADDAMQLTTTMECCPVRAYALYVSGGVQVWHNRYDEAEVLFTPALVIARFNALPRVEIDCLAAIAQTYHRRGNFPRTLEILQEAYPLAVAEGYRLGEAIVLARLGNAYDRLGDYPAALEAHLASLKISEEVGDYVGVMSCLNNVGNVQIQLMDYPTALKTYQCGIEMARLQNNLRFEGLILGNMGLAYTATKEYAKSVQAQKASLIIKDEMGDVQGTANTLGNLGAALLEQENLAEARAYLERAVQLHHEMGDKHGEVHNLIHLSKLVTKEAIVQNRTGEDALTFITILEKALSLAGEGNSPELQHGIHKAFAESWRLVGNHERALYHYEQFHSLKEKLFTQAIAQRAHNLKTLHTIEQTRLESEIHRLKTIELSEALQKAEEQKQLAERLAREDGLTGLLTRRYGEGLLGEAFAHAVTTQTPLSLILLDIDHFKQINDTYSHAVGDAVLRTLAALFQNHCRATDIIIRYGGEEFLFAFPQVNGTQAEEVCERLRLGIEQYAWNRLHPDLCVTASIGICDTTLGPHYEKMVICADTALYRAKHAGRNRVVRYSCERVPI